MIRWGDGWSAGFNPAGDRRFWFEYTTDPARPRLVWLLLNPSIAGQGRTGDDLDPTMRRIRVFTAEAHRKAPAVVPFQPGGFEVYNLWSWVDTDPDGLADLDPEATSFDHAWLTAAATSPGPIVVGWGSNRWARRRARIVVDRYLNPAGAQLLCLGKTKAGQPLHPMTRRALSGVLSPWSPPWRTTVAPPATWPRLS